MKQEFIKFLKSKRLWSKFEREFKDRNKTKGRTVNNYVKDELAIDYLSCAFYWENTEDGHEYWSELDYQWQEHLEKLKEE